MTRIELHGIYNVDAPYLCHLVEISIFGCTKECEELHGIVYPVTVGGRKTEQSPFCEHYLSLVNGEILGNFTYAWDHPEIWLSDLRVAFLMHFLEPGRKIDTPCGTLTIPPASVMPKRLATIQYLSPY
jgi:hypothetical protein